MAYVILEVEKRGEELLSRTSSFGNARSISVGQSVTLGFCEVAVRDTKKVGLHLAILGIKSFDKLSELVHFCHVVLNRDGFYHVEMKQNRLGGPSFYAFYAKNQQESIFLRASHDLFLPHMVVNFPRREWVDHALEVLERTDGDWIAAAVSVLNRFTESEAEAEAAAKVALTRYKANHPPKTVRS